MKKIAALVLAVAMAFSTVGCRHKDNNNVPEAPAIVFQRSLLGAADATVTIASANNAVNEVRKQLELTKQITPEQSQNLKKALDVVAKRNQAAVEAINVAETAGDINATNWRTAMLETVKAVQAIDPSLFGIKNPDAQATLRSTLASLNTIAQIVSISFGGK